MQQAAPDRVVRKSREFLERLLAGYRPRNFAVRFWDGSVWEPEPGRPADFTLALNHPGALRAMFWPPNGVAFGEAYLRDDFDVEGDVFAFIPLTGYLNAYRPGLWQRLRMGARLLALPAPAARPAVGHAAARLKGTRHSPERDRAAVGYHYDRSNDFFALWLDRELVYTCAYFADAGDDLDAAQQQKTDYLCRKLRLRPGERLLDIGCGWGSLVRHAARHYGVEAVGVTLSRRQAELAGERIRADGLAGTCRVEYADYREVDDPAGFDKIVSVGMMEHVGGAMLPTYFAAAWRLLRPGGVFLNHHITRRADVARAKVRQFARSYVFPDGDLPTLGESLRTAEAAGFEVRDVESLREHYALTLGHWVRRLEARREDAVRATSEATYRVFRLYLAGARQGFLDRAFNLHQALLAKPAGGDAGLPLTRADWYREPKS